MAKDSAGNRLPWFKMWAKDLMADPAVQALSWERRGRYLWALLCSWEGDHPGEAVPLDWGRWMGYSTEAWDAVESEYIELFGKHEEYEDVWVQKRLRAEYRAVRAEVDKKSASGRNANAIRWQSDRSPTGVRPESQSESDSESDSDSEKEESKHTPGEREVRLKERKLKASKKKGIMAAADEDWRQAFMDFFWEDYLKLGRECSKAAAWKAWMAIPHIEPQAAFDRLDIAFKKSQKLWADERKELKYIPHAATWLNDYHRNLLLDEGLAQ